MSKEAELGIKRARVSALLEQHRLAGLLLGRNGSVSWALAGAEAHIALNSERAGAMVLYTPHRDYVLTTQIELPRLLAEELPGLPFEPLALPWYAQEQQAELIAELAGGGAIASDIPLPGVQLLPRYIAALRYQLTSEEQDRLRELGRRASLAIETAAGELAPGMTEYAIAGLLAEECFLRNITPTLLLIGTDERALRFRHPIPTDKRLERYVMLVLSARRWGLIVSLTRLLHFGAIPVELRQRAEACARIDAAAMAATRPETTAEALFSQIESAYAAEKFADEWHNHHQGGAAGYEDREWVATPGSAELVHVNQAFAWNPSLPGVKSEDTILVQSGGVEIVTQAECWPRIALPGGDGVIERPTVLEVD